jgi:hypothetical protein
MTRTETLTQKIEKSATGLDGAIFVHVDHDGAGKVLGVRFATKWRGGEALDKILHGIGDAASALIDVATGAKPFIEESPEPKRQHTLAVSKF